MPHLADALKTFLAVTPKTALHSRVKKTSGYSCPINVRVDALLGDLLDIIERAGGWDIRIADLMRQPAEVYEVWIGEQPREVELTGVERALDIRRIHKKINDVVGLDRKFVKRLAPCPECDMPTLGHWLGEIDVECLSCEFKFTLEEYAIYVSDLVE